MINIDTLMMQRAVSEMNAACNEIDRAVSIIQSVKQHDDWNCKERIKINESIVQASKNIVRLRDAAYSYSNALRDAANGFEDQEKSIGGLFKNVTQAISDVFKDLNQWNSITIQPVSPQKIIEDFFRQRTDDPKWMQSIMNQLVASSYSQIGRK